MVLDDTTKQSSIAVSVRVRPFTNEESEHLIHISESPSFVSEGQLLPELSLSTEQLLSIRKIVNVVDEKMLIFDPPETSPLVSAQRKLFPNRRFRSKIRDRRFVFDQLFDEDATQQDVYAKTTKPLLDSIIDGYNATVFAYGATGCGKTHTILGTPQDPGVIYLTLKELYERIDQLSDERVFDVTVSFLEIYNETIRDLLNPETPTKMLNLREDAKNKITVSNLLTHKPVDLEGIKQLIVVGNRNRTSSPTEANSASSRSHAVLQINVALQHRTASLTSEHIFATLSIIDLAGSERAANTKNRGATLHEGANINKSLLALGNCINALCDPRRKYHVPYRDLKLTRLLKFSLGGNCKTVMIVCISPLSQHYDETFNTLKYADRVKEIKTKIVRNRQNLDRHVGSYLKMITEQRQEIEELRAREAKAIEVANSKVHANNKACLEAIMQHMQSLKSIIDRQVSEKWKKYYVLAKRKLLLSNLNDLEIIYSAMKSHREQMFSQRFLSSIEHCFMQVEQLKNKFNELILYLEKLYDSSSEIEEALNRSREHNEKRFQELEGWTETHTQLYNSMFEAVEDHLQNDLLLNSSVLFDYLTCNLNDFQFLPHAFYELSQMGTDSIEDRNLSQIFDNASKVLEMMNNSDYDIMIEELTSSFMTSKLKLGNVNETIFSPRERKHIDVTKKPDKRTNSSPMRNSPASKRAIRMHQEDRSDSNVEMDTSIEISMINRDDDSPLSDRINNSIIDPEELTFEPLLDSPPLSKINKALDIKKPKLLSADKFSQLDYSSSVNSFTKVPLLNKQASNKVLSNINNLPEMDQSIILDDNN